MPLLRKRYCCHLYLTVTRYKNYRQPREHDRQEGTLS
jgi:hypothetical protein